MAVSQGRRSDSIAEAIVAVVEADGTACRDAIRQRWCERYSANVNYPTFAHELAELAARKAP